MSDIKLTRKEDYICKLLFLVSPIIGYLQIPARNTIVSLLFLMVFAVYWGKSRLFRKLSTSYPLLLWLLLTLFHCINALVKHVPEVNVLDILHGLKIYSCICIFYYWGIVDFKSTIKILVSCFICYLCISFVVCDWGGNELGGRMTGAIYATALGQTAAISCFYIIYHSFIKRMSIGKSFLYFLLPFVVIILTQSRNSLAMMIIAILAYILVYINGRNTSKRILALSLIGIVSLLITYNIFIHSDFANRIIEVSDQHESSYQYRTYGTDTIFDKIVGDRLIYYVLGFQLFLKSPITGIGMWNYKYAVDGVYPLHTEYMVHLCEGGLIAATLWLLFWIYIIWGSYKYVVQKEYRIIVCLTIVQLLFCALYARLFYYEFFYPIIGITLSLIWIFKKGKHKVSNYDKNKK